MSVLRHVAALNGACTPARVVRARRVPGTIPPMTPDERAHHRRRFSGRDPEEGHRAATPLELLYDLTFVVAFGIAANELAHYLADGEIWTAIVGFAIAAFAVAWGVDQLLVVRVRI